jgi:hypothetical protein
MIASASVAYADNIDESDESDEIAPIAPSGGAFKFNQLNLALALLHLVHMSHQCQAAVLNKPAGRIAYRFHARDLHVVMGPPRRDSHVRFRVSIDGQRPGAAHGFDVDDAGNGTIVEPRLYQLIRQPKAISDRQFEIEFLDAGAEAFAFTFG